MSAESGHLSTFGAETETEAEIRSTSRDNWFQRATNIKMAYGESSGHVTDYVTRP